MFTTIHILSEVAEIHNVIKIKIWFIKLVCTLDFWLGCVKVMQYLYFQACNLPLHFSDSTSSDLLTHWTFKASLKL